jgi:hypothetical protein
MCGMCKYFISANARRGGMRVARGPQAPAAALIRTFSFDGKIDTTTKTLISVFNTTGCCGHILDRHGFFNCPDTNSRYGFVGPDRSAGLDNPEAPATPT